MTAARLAAAALVALLVLGYAVGSGLLVSIGGGWYATLEQPAWQPPPAVFGLAWTYNFAALAVVGLVMALQAPRGPLTWFLVTLAGSIVLALGWAYLFYGPHLLLAAALILSAAALFTVVPLALAFGQAPWLGWVLVPYQAWLVVAASLSWGYWALSSA